MGRRLKIFFTSDIHGHLFPTSYRDAKQRPLGLHQLQRLFQKDENTLIIDGGDSLQGSPLTYLCHDEDDPEWIAEKMNEAGYDYVTLGNHDFNYGLPYLKRYADALDAKVLCQNVTDEQGRCLFPHTIHSLPNGWRVGLVGAVTDSVNIWERKEHLVGCQVLDVRQELEKVAQTLKAQCDLTICIYHGGYEGDLERLERSESGRENIGIELCREMDFDVLLCCHQHMLTPGRSLFGTYTLQNAPNAATCFEIDICEQDSGEGHSISSTLHHLSDLAALPLSPLSEADAERFSRLQAWLDRPIGHLPEALRPEDRVEMARHGSKLADFINEIQRAYLQTELSCTSFANDIPGLPQDVRIRDLLLTYPFPNTLVALDVTGKVLKAALERSAEYLSYSEASGALEVSKHFLEPKVEHYNFDFFLGIKAQIDWSAPFGERVRAIYRGEKEVSPEDHYSLAMNNYRASGAGGYAFYQDCAVLKRDARDVFDVLCDYFLQQKAQDL